MNSPEVNEKDNFQQILDLAKYSANRIEERRSIEFKMFISYMTLLVLAFYQVMQISSISISQFRSWWLIVSCIIIHILYFMLQVGIAKAMQNDVIKRNHYSKRAESLSGYPVGYENFQDKSKVEGVKNFGHLFCYLNVVWTQWPVPFLIGIPTLSFIIFIGLLWYKLPNLT